MAWIQSSEAHLIQGGKKKGARDRPMLVQCGTAFSVDADKQPKLSDALKVDVHDKLLHVV